MADAADLDGLDRFRHYLLILARSQMAGQAHARIDASDIVQDTLLEAHRQRDQFRGRTDAEMAGWLRAMLACNLVDAERAMHRAKRDVARERSLEGALAQSSSTLEAWLAAAQSSPSQHIQRQEQLFQLADALVHLPEEQRIAVELKHLQGWSVAAIAERLGKTETAVGGLLRRGMTKLRELLAAPP